jgi:mevalonate kinase
VKRYYSNGKLLLTGEYLVLDGAISLALPTQFGQHLFVEEIELSKIVWVSLDEHQNIWHETEFEIVNNTLAKKDDNEISKRLFEIFIAVQKLNSDFLKKNKGFKITTLLEFPKNWGLGTSSTLINNIAHWAKVDAFKLLDLTFGGSGYDIACAQNDTGITYQLIQTSSSSDLENDNKRIINQVTFDPVFKDQLYFVYLNRKQDSRKGIARYKMNTSNLREAIFKVNQITENMISCVVLDDFNSLIDKHEQLISKIINQKPIKEELFQDFNGSIKSLGAWGGDFVLVTSKSNPTNYFKSKGFETILGFDSMVKNK